MVLHNLKSPANVGTIIRSQVAFGGSGVVFVGQDKPWRFKKSTEAFSRRLERISEIIYLETDDDFFGWCSWANYSPVAIEIAEEATVLPQFEFPSRSAIVVGNEGKGLSPEFVSRCSSTVVVPQFGDVACLNVGVSAAIAMYELRRSEPLARRIEGAKFEVPVERKVSPP